MNNLIQDIERYIRTYNSPPYGREVEGTVELLEKCKNALKQQLSSEKKTVYLLISTYSGVIVTEQFATEKDAQDVMHRSMVKYGNVPKNIYENDLYDGDGYGFDQESGFVWNGLNGHQYNWRIVPVEL